jgi:hypothetical protein
MFSFLRVSLFLVFFLVHGRGAPSPTFSAYFGQIGVSTLPYGKGFIFDSVYRHLFELDITVGQGEQAPKLSCAKFQSKSRQRRSIDLQQLCPEPDFDYDFEDLSSVEEEKLWVNLRVVPDCLDYASEQCVLRTMVTPNFTLTWYRRVNATNGQAYVESTWKVFPEPQGKRLFKIIDQQYETTNTS